jgi:hypothetical protein
VKCGLYGVDVASGELTFLHKREACIHEQSEEHLGEEGPEDEVLVHSHRLSDVAVDKEPGRVATLPLP